MPALVPECLLLRGLHPLLLLLIAQTVMILPSVVLQDFQVVLLLASFKTCTVGHRIRNAGNDVRFALFH